jgi:hypothetical protein
MRRCGLTFICAIFIEEAEPHRLRRSGSARWMKQKAATLRKVAAFIEASAAANA